MPTIYTKDARTGAEERIEVTEEEMVNRGLRKSAAQRAQDKGKRASEVADSPLVSGLVDLVMAARDGALDGMTKADVAAYLKQRVEDSL